MSWWMCLFLSDNTKNYTEQTVVFKEQSFKSHEVAGVAGVVLCQPPYVYFNTQTGPTCVFRRPSRNAHLGLLTQFTWHR